MECKCEILDQLAEIDARFRRKIKDQLIAVEAAFDIDQTHRETACLDPFGTDAHRLRHISAVLFECLQILLICEPEDRLQRCGDAVIRHCVAPCRDLTAFGAARRFDDDIAALRGI